VLTRRAGRAKSLYIEKTGGGEAMQRVLKSWGAALLWLALAGAVACVPLGSDVRSAREAAERGNAEDALLELERLRESDPDDFQVRLVLGQVYENRQKDYILHLGKSLEEVVEAARIDPESPSTHTWMGIILAYQDDLDSALTSFQNARQLGPVNPVTYTNIAQIYLYQGHIARSRNWVDKAKRKGARGTYVDLLESLLAWRQGDLVEARDLFDLAYGSSPAEVNTWDEAPVDEPIEDFEGFTAYCCSNHTCGPHMGKACQKMELAVKERELLDETVREELLIEMKRRRKLREIYKGRRDLEIDIEPVSPGSAAKP
jgi:tetratricopeptide (TPR) repeat protein